MARIFISYRRDDSAGHAGRLYDLLSDRFGSDLIFMDIDTIEPGVDFVDVIEQAVSVSDVFIAVIGKRWLNVQDYDGRRRLDNPEDFVRLEIVTALNRHIRVIPVLVQGATMPQPAELPEDLRSLASRNAVELRDVTWRSDVGRLVEALTKILDQPQSWFDPAQNKNEIIPQPLPKAPTEDQLDIQPSTVPLSSTGTTERSVDKEPYVFICYARQDEDFVLELAAYITNKKIQVWLDQWMIKTGDNWDKKIETALLRCDKFLIILSPSATESEEVMGELRTALDERKVIIPVLFEMCPIPRQIKRLTYANFTSDGPGYDVALDNLLQSLDSSELKYANVTNMLVQKSLKMQASLQRSTPNGRTYEEHLKPWITIMIGVSMFLVMSIWVVKMPDYNISLLASIMIGWISSITSKSLSHQSMIANITFCSIGGLFGSLLTLASNNLLDQSEKRLLSLFASCIGAIIVVMLINFIKHRLVK